MEISFLDHQWEFLQSGQKFTGLVGGIGSGKTFVGSAFIYDLAMRYQGKTFLIGANSYKQLRRVTVRAFLSFLELTDTPYSYHQTNNEITIGESKIICATMSEYHDLRGIEISGFWLDECRDMVQEAWTVIIGRLRERGGPHLGRITTSPRGYNWIYDYFVGERKTHEYHLIRASSHDNIYLPDGYIETLQDYDSKMYKQEILGNFINLTQGNVYYAFDRNKNVQEIDQDPNVAIYIGQDFNINPMAGVIANIYNDRIYIFDEIWLETSNTNEVAEYIKEKYGTGHTVIPDSTGKALKTSAAGKSDHSILQEHGFKIPHVKNPPRQDRYNIVNNMLEKQRIIIHPRCKHLIKDLERLLYKDGTNLPDVTNKKDAGHIADSLGYLANHYFPLRKRKIGVSYYA